MKHISPSKSFSIPTPKSGIADPRIDKQSQPPKSTSRARKTRVPVGWSTTRDVLGVEPQNRALMIKVVKKGLPFHALKVLEERYRVSGRQISKALGMAPATLTRRSSQGKLSQTESERVFRLASLLDSAILLMNGDHSAALEWLNRPMAILDNETPLVHAETELGAKDVEDLIGRIRYGVFS